MHQIEVRWTTPSGAAVNVFNFAEAVPIAGQRAALASWLNDITGSIAQPFLWTIPTEGRTLDPDTGLTTAFWNDSVVLSGAGKTAGQQVADSTQILFRWRTADVVAGRRVQGRTFIPGMVTAYLNNGNVANATLTTLQAAATALVSADVGLGVWSRPTEGRAGSFHEATSGSAWNELAVQRGRRG